MNQPTIVNMWSVAANQAKRLGYELHATQYRFNLFDPSGSLHQFESIQDVLSYLEAVESMDKAGNY